MSEQSVSDEYSPEEVAYDDHEGEYVPFGGERLCLTSDELDEICWRIVETFTNFTPVRKEVADTVGYKLGEGGVDVDDLLEDDEFPFDEAIALVRAYEYEIGYHHGIAIFMADMAQTLWNQGVDVKARALRYEREIFDETEADVTDVGPVHTELIEADEVGTPDSDWIEGPPTELLEESD